MMTVDVHQKCEHFGLGRGLESYDLGLGLATAGLHYIPEFWQHNQATLSKLYLTAMRALSVSASSAAVERVFSHGGIIMRPHRSRMSDKLLSNMVFLKCNCV